MLQEIKKMSNEHRFAIASIILGAILIFLFGYVFFRYWQLDVCKPLMQIYK